MEVSFKKSAKQKNFLFASNPLAFVSHVVMSIITSGGGKLKGSRNRKWLSKSARTENFALANNNL